MFDLRYHVASLAAIFLALAVGIILGVALSGKIRGAEDSLSAGRIAELEDQLNAARERGSSEQEMLQHSEDLINDAYPALMENRLVDRGYAIVFLGPVDGELRSAIEKTLSDADGTPVRLFAFELPVDPASLNDFLESKENLAEYGGDPQALGRALGEELMEEGDTPLLDEVSSELVEERSGTTIPAVDGAIVVQSWAPDSEDSSTASNRASEEFIDGVLQGLQSASLPVVGVETSDVDTRDLRRSDLQRRRGLERRRPRPPRGTAGAGPPPGRRRARKLRRQGHGQRRSRSSGRRSPSAANWGVASSSRRGTRRAGSAKRSRSSGGTFRPPR